MTLNKNAVRNSDLQIFITTSGITASVIITKPDASTNNCAAPIGGPGLCTSSDLSQDLVTGVTTYSISSLVRSTDEGTWSAAHGTSDTNTIDIKVLTIPTLTVTQTVSALTLSSSNTQSLTITAICAYPAVSLDLYFVPTGGGTTESSPSSTATCTSTGNTGCADTDANGYNCVIVPKLETSLSAGTYYVQFVVKLAGQYEPIGLNSTITDTVITVEAATTTTTPATTTTTTPASSKICDSCKKTIALAVSGLFVAVVCVALCLKMYSKFRESGGGKGKFKCSVTWCFRATIIATVVSVIGFILCIAGLIICVTCDDSVSSSNSVTVGFALAVVGFVLAAVTLVIVIILVILFCRGVITKKDDGQTIKHVSVKNNDPLTLTCPAGDLATTLTWTGPGGIPYVTGTTVEADLDGSVKRRISASHKKRGYALMFTEVWSSDMGIYTSTVDETVVKHEVIVQDNKAVRARPDGQDAKPRTERTPRSAGSPTSASNIKTKWRNNQVSDSNESDGSNDTPRRKLEAVPPGRKLPALGLVDASQKANPLEPIEVNETKKLKKKKKRRSKEERAQVISENTDNEQSDAQYVLLPHQVSDMSPPSGTQLNGTVQTDHSITRQEPGHEEKEGQTVDSHTNNTHL